MSIELYYFSGSPFAWRVQLGLEHKGLDYELQALNPSKGEHRSESFLKLNPHGKVPVLQHDGFTLYESSAIVEYLEERFPDTPRLFPTDLQRRAIARRVIAEIESVYWPNAWLIARNLYFKPKEEWNEEDLTTGVAGVAAELERYETSLDGDFLVGELGAADYALYTIMAHVPRYELRRDVGLSARIGPKLRAWMKRIESLPYFDRTYPPHWRA
jgi:glutathione S-transferase